MKCDKCENDIDSDAKFCSKCGKKIVEKKEVKEWKEMNKLEKFTTIATFVIAIGAVIFIIKLCSDYEGEESGVRFVSTCENIIQEIFNILHLIGRKGLI